MRKLIKISICLLFIYTIIIHRQEISIYLLIIYAIIIRRQVNRIEQKIDSFVWNLNEFDNKKGETDEQPDVIVRCKDCKHYKWESMRCLTFNAPIREDGFCSHGKRRTDDCI